MISTRTLNLLPKSGELKRICRAIAMLDAIMEQDWESRYYSYDSKWSAGQEMASMRDGSGDEVFVLFEPGRTILKGYAHESAFAAHLQASGTPYPGVLDYVPSEFAAFLSEPAFSPAETTFCIWESAGDWHTGQIEFPADADPDGSEALLSMFDGRPETYRRWCEEYYEASVPLESVARVYAHEPLSRPLVKSLNRDAALRPLKDDIIEIGYPLR